MPNIHGVYGRDLDLNLLRVFTVVADEGSVTRAAARLYVTQPAVSAALRRLDRAVGASLFVRQGRGVVLTARGQRLVARVRPHLEELARASLEADAFDPTTSERTIRLGLSDAAEAWLLPALLRWLESRAPRMRLVVLPVQFRTVSEALATGQVDVAVTVADELPAGTRRLVLFAGRFVCLYDGRRARLGRRVSRERYFAAEHVIVSYNGDLRGVVEDSLGVARRVRCSIASFQGIGAVIEGTALLATVPETVARAMMRRHRTLRVAELPFALGAGSAMELLWRASSDDDEAHRFVREGVARIARART